nr:polysaccharide biosynthesis C-terminal domain-containing protein [Saprospiraceae bacterium]
YLDKHSLSPKLLSFNKAEESALGSCMTFSLFNGLGASLALRLDNVMIGSMLTVNAVYIYGTILTISNVIEIPSKAINNISSAVISSSWTNNDQANIQDIYQKSSVYGWIVGLLLFLLIYFIWIDIIALMPGKIQMELSSILLIFTLLSFARIIDLVTGVNSVILSYSSLYKYHMYFLIILGIVNIVLNYFLIQRLGIAGAALATCISYVIFNLMKYYFLKSRFGFSIHWQPHTAILVAGLIVFVIMHVLTFSFLPVINIVLKSIITSVLFGTLILIFNPGGEIRALADSYIRKFVRK